MAPLPPAEADGFALFRSLSGAADGLIPGPGAAERLLLDAANRALRAPESRIAVVLHLGRLASPGLKPHHGRIARALLTEAAQRHDGQLFLLGNGDLVLLCRPAATPTGCPDDPSALPGTFTRLFAGETAEPDTVVSFWPLAEQADRLLTYARERSEAAAIPATAVPRPSAPPRALLPPPLPGPAPLALPPAIPELLQRRTAALIRPTSGVRAHAIQALFRDVAFSPAALEAHYAPPGAGPTDPWLGRHLTHRFDEQLLALVEAALPGDGPLGMASAPADLVLHLSLSPQVVVKHRFEQFAHLCGSIGVEVGIEISLVAAMAAPAVFAAARTVLHRAGMRMVLGGISPQALRLVRLEALEADLWKLDWTPKLARLALSEQRLLEASLAAIGPERVVLQRADGEAALVWGLAQGINRFLGRHVDAMFAARRMLACPAAAACTLHQCAERAATATAPGRRLCRNLPLLDAGAPAVTPSIVTPP